MSAADLSVQALRVCGSKAISWPATARAPPTRTSNSLPMSASPGGSRQRRARNSPGSISEAATRRLSRRSARRAALSGSSGSSIASSPCSGAGSWACRSQWAQRHTPVRSGSQRSRGHGTRATGVTPASRSRRPKSSQARITGRSLRNCPRSLRTSVGSGGASSPAMSSGSSTSSPSGGRPRLTPRSPVLPRSPTRFASRRSRSSVKKPTGKVRSTTRRAAGAQRSTGRRGRSSRGRPRAARLTTRDACSLRPGRRCPRTRCRYGQSRGRGMSGSIGGGPYLNRSSSSEKKSAPNWAGSSPSNSFSSVVALMAANRGNSREATGVGAGAVFAGPGAARRGRPAGSLGCCSRTRNPHRSRAAPAGIPASRQRRTSRRLTRVSSGCFSITRFTRWLPREGVALGSWRRRNRAPG